MKLKLLAVSIIAVLFCACGTVRKIIGKDGDAGREDSIATSKVILYPEGSSQAVKMEKEWSDKVAATGKQKEKPVDPRYIRRPRKERPSLSFTEDQSRYLQIAGINPLPESGLLELDLTSMAGDFCYPYDGNVISVYGPRGNSFHTGLDIKAVPDDTVRAAFPGVVRMSKDYSGYGNIVVVRHYQGFETVYAHGSKNLVKVNDVVEPGDPIALAGRTGRATTEHLHFEFRAADGHIDPAKILDTDNRRLRRGKLYITELNGSVVAYSDTLELSRLKEAAEIAADNTTDVKPEINVRVGAIPTAPGEAVYYNVKSGDTLSAIAVRYKTTVSRLCQLNNIKSTSLLQINQRLRVR